MSSWSSLCIVDHRGERAPPFIGDRLLVGLRLKLRWKGLSRAALGACRCTYVLHAYNTKKTLQQYIRIYTDTNWVELGGRGGGQAKPHTRSVACLCPAALHRLLPHRARGLTRGCWYYCCVSAQQM